MSEWIAIVVASLALIISGVTAWLTLLRTGDLRMTQPTMVFFGPDGPARRLKVFLRTLLYSTARRGQTVESMHVNLNERSRGRTSQSGFTGISI